MTHIYWVLDRHTKMVTGPWHSLYEVVNDFPQVFEPGQQGNYTLLEEVK